MIIHSPVLTEVESHVQISARIELAANRKGIPEELWFRFPREFKSQISTDVDPFVVSLLLLAMQNQEKIQVRGALSRRLFQGLSEYQNIYHSWFPERFKKIVIEVEDLREERENPKSGVACAFSGGVDSFYTFLKLIGTSHSPGLDRPTHTLFMAGFDMPLRLRHSIQELVQSYSVMMKDLGVQFIAGSTNIRSFVNSIDWTNAHGQALVASALFFKTSLNRFYIPASYTMNSYPKWGSHPSLDFLLSTESLRMIHHGADSNRVQKLETVSLSPESYQRLRVCWIQDIGLRNCGQCEKCIRTMVALEILNVFPFYKTFGSEVPSSQKIRALKMRTHQARLFAHELIREAVRRKKYRIGFNLGYSLLRREIVYRSRSL